MKTRKYDTLSGPFESNDRKEVFNVLRKFLSKHGIKLTSVKRKFVCGMTRIKFEGYYENNTRFFTSIEDRSRIDCARGLDYTLENISLNMIK